MTLCNVLSRVQRLANFRIPSNRCSFVRVGRWGIVNGPWPTLTTLPPVSPDLVTADAEKLGLYAPVACD